MTTAAVGDGAAPRDGKLERLTLCLAFAAAAVTLLVTALVVVVGYVNVPFWDQWGYVRDGDLWRQPLKHHNEHMIVVARVFYTIDAWLGGRQVFNMASELAIQAGAAAAMTGLGRLGGARRDQTAWLAAACVAFAFSPSQYDNFVWGFQVQFLLVYAALAAGALFAVLHARTGRTTWLALAVAAAAASAGSMANGLLAAPVLAGLLATLGRRRAAAIMLAAAAAFAALYAVGPPAPGNAVAEAFGPVPRLLASPRFGLAYLGAPFAWTFQASASAHNAAAGGADVVPWAVVDGVVVAALAGAALLSLLRDGAPGREGRRGLGAVLLFGLFSVAATTWGRVILGPEQAMAPRYATPVMTIVGSAVLILWLRVQAERPSGRAASWIAAGVAGGLLVFAVGSHVLLKPVTNVRLARESSMLALAARASGSGLLQAVAYAPDRAVADSVDLRRHGRSLFGERWAKALGGPLSAVADRGVGGRCDGAIALQSGDRAVLNGTVRVPRSLPFALPRAIVLVDPGGKVVGVGRVRARLKNLIALRAKTVDWTGVLAPDLPTPSVAAYLLTEGGRRACPIAATELGAPLAVATGAPDRLEPLPTLGLVRDGKFEPGGANPEPGPAPMALVALGSWAGADANTGRIVSEYRVPPGVNAVVLPLVTGPITDRQSLVLRLKGEARAIGMADLRDARRWTWERLELPPRAAGGVLQVEAQDRGADWGEWIAVGPVLAAPSPPTASH